MNFKQLVLMNLQALTNFPYIEKDFDAVTDYQLLCLVVDHLNEVIKNSNEQNTVIQNLYNAFVTLKDYVDNYFDNLDIQEEIDNKLDEMAASGELADIIAQYLEVASVLGFDTKASLKSADNLVNGSITRTLGEDTYNDGKGAFYKVRILINTDVIDDDNLVALTNYPTLVAEKMPDYRLNQVENNISNIITNKQTITNLVIISDSYGVGNSAPIDPITSFAEYMKTYLGLDNDHYYNNSYGGCGFAYENNNKKFITLVNEANNTLSSDRKNAVSDVLFAGGYNDQFSSESDILSNISTTIVRAHEVFPNAKIWVAFIGWNTNTNNMNDVFRYWNDGTNKTKYGKFISNTQNILTSDLICSDHIHPNEDGYKKLAYNLVQGLQTGSCYPISPFKYLKDTNDNNLGVVQCNNDTLTFEMYDLEFNHTGTANGNEVTYCTLPDDSMISGKALRFTVPCMFVNNTSFQYVSGYCVWYIQGNTIKLLPICLKSDGTNYFDYTSIKFIHSTYNINHKYI